MERGEEPRRQWCRETRTRWLVASKKTRNYRAPAAPQPPRRGPPRGRRSRTTDRDMDADDLGDDAGDARMAAVAHARASDEDGPVTRVATRTPIEMEEWGERPTSSTRPSRSSRKSSSKRASTTRSACTCARSARSACSRPTTRSASPARWKNGDYIQRIERLTSSESAETPAAWTSSCGSCSDLVRASKPHRVRSKELGVKQLPLVELIVKRISFVRSSTARWTRRWRPSSRPPSRSRRPTRSRLLVRHLHRHAPPDARDGQLRHAGIMGADEEACRAAGGPRRQAAAVRREVRDLTSSASRTKASRPRSA